MARKQGNRRPLPLALAAALLGLSAPVAAEAPEWRKLDASTAQLAAIVDLEALARAFPDSASVRLRLLNAYLEADETAAVLRVASELARDGHVFSPGARELLLSLGPSEEQAALLARQEATAAPLMASRAIATIPAEFELVEGVWRDPRSGALFATTVVSRALIASRGEGWQPIALEGAGSLSGMAYDDRARLLWIASGVFEQTPDPETAFRGLFAVDPDTGAIERRVAAPATATPGDLAVGPAGEVYASDPLSGAVYVAYPGDERLRALVAPGTFRSPQGLAPLARGSLVVSDYGYGLALVDAASGTVARVELAADADATLDGIDGLWRSGERLIAIRNGSRPMQIAELHLSPDGATVRQVVPLERAHPEWAEPVGGALSGGELVYVATGQWDRFGAGGERTGDRPPGPTEVRALPIGEISASLP